MYVKIFLIRYGDFVNYCNNCGTKLDENKEICVNCSNSIISSSDGINKDKYDKKKLILSNIFSGISFILALIPIILFIAFLIFPSLSEEGGAMYMVIYIYFYNTPVAIASLIFGLISNKIKKNKLALVGYYFNLLPLAIAILWVCIYIFNSLNALM